MAWIEILYPAAISALTLVANVALTVSGHRPRRPGVSSRARGCPRAGFALGLANGRCRGYCAVSLGSETDR
jgi:hypothetical protein